MDKEGTRYRKIRCEEKEKREDRQGPVGSKKISINQKNLSNNEHDKMKEE